MSQHRLDVRGQLCPIPVIRTQNQIKKLAPGDILEILCTDPGALHDVPAWCRIHGHKVIHSQTKDDGDIVIGVEVGHAD